MVGLDRHRGQLVAVVEPVEGRPPHRAVRRSPGDGADRLLRIETPEGRAADRLDAGGPGHLAEIALLGQPREGGLARVGLRRLDRDRPQHRDRLVPDLAVRVRPRDPPDGRGVGQPNDGGQPHAGVRILGCNGREHVLGVVLQVVHGRGPHQRILVLPTRLAAQSVEQTHEAVWSRSVRPWVRAPWAVGDRRRRHWTAPRGIMHTRGQKWRVARNRGEIDRPAADRPGAGPSNPSNWIEYIR